MKLKNGAIISCMIFILGNGANAQRTTGNVTPAPGPGNSSESLSISLVCPFEHGSGREPKEAFTYNPPDKKVIMISRQDSLVRACVAGHITNVQQAEDNHYEIVINSGNIYYWYFAVMRPTVTKGTPVSPGQTIGIYTFGTELEFRMYQNEDMLDPRNLLECKIPKAND